jgi:DNA-binding transcriptional ArsR family regulator
MDVSFADEVVIRMGEELVSGFFGQDQGIILQGLGDDSIKNLTAAVRLQKLKIAFLVIKSSGEWECVGQLEQNLRDTLNLLFTQGRLTAPDLVKRLGLAVNTASTRLKRLYDLHLVKRDYEITDNGLQYIYQFWPFEDPKHD